MSDKFQQIIYLNIHVLVLFVGDYMFRKNINTKNTGSTVFVTVSRMYIQNECVVLESKNEKHYL